jgi:hypothetical protein
MLHVGKQKSHAEIADKCDGLEFKSRRQYLKENRHLSPVDVAQGVINLIATTHDVDVRCALSQTARAAIYGLCIIVVIH